MKKTFKKITFIIIATLVSVMLISCSSLHPDNDVPPYNDLGDPNDALGSEHVIVTEGNEFSKIKENPFLEAADYPESSFSLTVSTAAYSTLRRTINSKANINPNQIKIEEIINYFKYDYPAPEGDDPILIQPSLFDCPWNEESKLLTVGLRAKDVELDSVRNNLVFLLDVSGSMYGEDRLGLMQTAFGLLLDNLDQNDTVSIVTYAGSNRVLLRGESASEKTKIRAIIEDLQAGGSTAGANGLVTAYEIAEQNFIKDGNNRVILATDGDFNVGVSSNSGLEELISSKRDSGIYLTTLGFGFGNLKSDKLETLANKGNGNFAYIDTISEAKKVLVEEIGGTLHTVARDTKAQVVFNPEIVESYRLLGYENLLLTKEEWEEDQTDAGEVGAGFTMTAVYEIKLADTASEGEFCDVKLRYKSPNIENQTVHEISVSVTNKDYYENPNDDMLFISALVEMSLVLRDSQFKGDANLDRVIERVSGLELSDPYRQEFADLLQQLSDYNWQ